MISDVVNWQVWRYVLNDEDFIDIYGAELDPPGDEFPCACYLLPDGTFVTMSDEEGMRMFFSLSEYDI